MLLARNKSPIDVAHRHPLKIRKTEL
jgi:hypothetical protein